MARQGNFRLLPLGKLIFPLLATVWCMYESGRHVTAVGWHVTAVPVNHVPRIVASDPDPKNERNRLDGVYPLSLFI